jgi:hypothetical protein
MPRIRNIDDLKAKLDKLPKEKEITVVYKSDTLKQIMDLLEKELQLIR